MSYILYSLTPPLQDKIKRFMMKSNCNKDSVYIEIGISGTNNIRGKFSVLGNLANYMFYRSVTHFMSDMISEAIF